jgi:hypothetical protein
LSLSHNYFDGTLPSSVFNRKWNLLDLSYNKISGILSNFVSQDSESVIYLEDNRLSGIVPHSLQVLNNVSILEGNMFECDTQKSSLPNNDKSKETYQCGSNAFNIPYYVWLGLTFLFILIVTSILYCNKKILNGTYNRQKDYIKKNKIRKYKNYKD